MANTLPNTAGKVVVKMAPNGGLVATTTGVTLRSTQSAGGGRSRFDQLDDVVPDTGLTVAGAVPVYDPGLDKYVVKEIDLDGGYY